MYITSGTLKGRKLLFEKSSAVRPTTEKVRAAVFDIFSDWVKDKTVLELFCGSGAVGIEALSRGAMFVDFVDVHVRTVVKNVKALDLGEHCHIYRKDALAALKIIGAKEKKYDLIFLDPPYEYPKIAEILKIIDEFAIVKANGFVILEHKKGLQTDHLYRNMQLKKTYAYGQTSLTLFERHE